MTNTTSLFLIDIPGDPVRAALPKAGGKEIESGELESPESSASLAVYAFGWHLKQPADLPPLPSLRDFDWPACRIDVECAIRFAWRGGRHPWLDAAVDTGLLGEIRAMAGAT